MMRHVAWITVLLLGCTAAISSAQDFSYLVPGFYGHRHASTAAEGAARGMGDVIRSQGLANLLNSEAAKNIEDARRKYIENRLQATNTYFQMREANRQYRDAKRRNPPTQDQLIRMSQEQLPERPSASQLDPLTGAIDWPLALQTDNFAEEREELERLYSERAEQGQFGAEEYREVRRLTSQMLDELKRTVDQYPGNLSIAARKFLEGLSYEAQFQAG